MYAFDQETSYLEIGVELLKQVYNHWKEHYESSLALRQVYAVTLLYSGNIHKEGVIVQILLNNAMIIKNKLPMMC